MALPASFSVLFVSLMTVCCSSLTQVPQPIGRAAQHSANIQENSGSGAATLKRYFGSDLKPNSSAQSRLLQEIASRPCNNDGNQRCDVKRCGIKCFQNCSLSCLDEINSNPTVARMTCFLQDGCTGTDPIVTSIPNGQVRLQSTATSNETQDSIVVSGSYTFSFNLTLLRSSGLVFNQFSATASSRKLAECAPRVLSEAIRFRVKFDDLVVWAHTFKAVRLFRLILDIPSSVQSLSLIVKHLPYSVTRNPAKYCFVGEWIQPVLSHRAPLLQSCYRRCLSTKSRQLYLHCLLPVCPGACASRGTKNFLINVEGKGQVCPQCNATDCSSDKPVARSIKAATNNKVTFHVDALRRRGYHFRVFRTNVEVEQTGSRLCVLPVTFRILLDGKEVQYRAVGQTRFMTETIEPTSPVRSKEREMVVVVSDADRLTLEATTRLESRCNVTLKWDNPRLVYSLPSPTFKPCNNTCSEELKRGQFYLSCFLGVCDRTVARSSNPPFFRLNYHHVRKWVPGNGIGANRAGSWKQGGGLIQLTNRDGYVTKFPFGIGAHPDASITFDLDAFRRHGYKFNFFVSTIGVDSGSGCSSKQLASVIFRVYADDVMLSNTPIHSIRESKTILHDVRNAGQLTLVTRVGFGDACHHAVWAGARLTDLRFPTTMIN